MFNGIVLLLDMSYATFHNIKRLFYFGIKTGMDLKDALNKE